MQEEEIPLTQPFNSAKHISQIGYLLILLALVRLKWQADGLDVVELLKDFRIKMDYGYVRKRHYAKPELFGSHQGGLLKVSDPQVKEQVQFLLRVMRVLPYWKMEPPPSMCIRDDTANYFAWTPSSFGIQAATDGERDEEESRRAAVAARRVKPKRVKPKKDIATPLLD